eukprot:TRINITY_DN3859_c1_g1_i2.p1 TRINITY_DN3859_c1_g1~~TRINITY_DN3859_c1_g1_i2.p1  ORF type:complete len:350 (-),score=98.55 TRINITY_DN3859_c1_g1_i2:29-1078(-)
MFFAWACPMVTMIAPEIGREFARNNLGVSSCGLRQGVFHVGAQTFVLLIFLILIVVLLGGVHKTLFRIQVKHYFVRECRGYTIFSILGIVLIIIGCSVANLIWPFFDLIMFNFVFLAFSSFSIWAPFFEDLIEKTMHNPHVKMAHLVENREELLLKLLNNLNGFEVFKQFLMKEFSVENLFFYSAATQFYNRFDPNVENPPSKQEMFKAAVEIWRIFLDNDSSLCVNLNFKTRDAIAKRFPEHIVKKSSAPRPPTRTHSLKKAMTSKTTLLTPPRPQELKDNNLDSVDEVQGDEDPQQKSNIDESEIEDMGDVVPDMFEQAKRDLMFLMSTDSFQRFCANTPDWEKYLE